MVYKELVLLFYVDYWKLAKLIYSRLCLSQKKLIKKILSLK